MSECQCPCLAASNLTAKVVHVAYAAAAAQATKGSPAVTQTCTEHTAHAAVVFFANVGRVRAAPPAPAAQQHTVIERSPGVLAGSTYCKCA